MKVFTRVIKEKIQENMAQLSEEQSGFRAGRSCLDNIHCLRQIIEKNKAKNIDTLMTFIDLEKAYDSIPQSNLWQAMDRMEVPKKWIGIVKRMYMNATAKIKIGKRATESIKITKGLKQGCCLSPMLFNIYRYI